MIINIKTKFNKVVFTAALSATLLSACETTTQYTSGQDYLARYDNAPKANTLNNNRPIDNEIRSIAAVEPDIRFPARIGLARIDRGSLASVPFDEAEQWRSMAASLGPSFGDFIPVSPLIAASVDRPKYNRHTTSFDIMSHIRKGAARQHIDYVLIYEVTRKQDKRGNALSFADASILGLFVIPSKKIDVASTASAILLDVRNGYPYLTSTEFAEDSGLSTSIHSRSQSEKLADKTRLKVIANLSSEIEHGIRELQVMSYNHVINERVAELE